jgi:hypothetical protein
MNAPEGWYTDGAVWWTDLATLPDPAGNGKALLAAARKAGWVPWVMGGAFGVEPGPGGGELDFLEKTIWPGPAAAAMVPALRAEYAKGSIREPQFPLKYVHPDVDRRVQVVMRHCVTNTLTFAKETGKDNKSLVRAVQAIRDDFPWARRSFIAWRRRDGRVAHYDMVLPGLLLALRHRLENQPGIGFDRDHWIREYTKSHREAEAGRVIWFVRHKLELSIAVGQGGRIHIDTGDDPDAIPPGYRARLITYGPEIADLLRRNGMVVYPKPMRQLVLDFNKHHNWNDVMRDAWGHR